MSRATPLHSKRLKKLPEEVLALQQAYPEASLELWSQDEHRIGRETDPAPRLGPQRDQSAGRGSPALSMDVSLWVCGAAERKDQLVAHADGQYRGLFPGAGGVRPRTGAGAGQTRPLGSGSSWLAHE